MKTEEIKKLVNSIKDNISKVIVGKDELITLILTAVISGGHILLEDTPGTGKTMLAKALAGSMGGDVKRVQFTPDLMPSDITGLNVYNQKNTVFELIKGPVFTNILLADEINRATPRTQSALLEAMQEKQVTIDGETIGLFTPFLVIATENPVETAGTYQLPEAQLDRFMFKLNMGPLSREDEIMVLDRYSSENPLESIQPVCTVEDIKQASEKVSKVYVHRCIKEYIVDIASATRHSSKISLGVSPRGSLTLLKACQTYAVINGRKYVIPDDVKYLAPYVLGHRMTGFSGAHQTERGYELINNILSTIPVPVENWEK